jgi:hypothetical protein
MSLDLFRKLGARLKTHAPENGQITDLSPAETLHLCAHMLWSLARQVEAHSAQAPYPHLAKRLQEIALEKDKMVNLLKEELSRSGKDFGQPRAAIKTGKNHWDRMREDVKDQKLLEAELLLHAARIAESAPEISALLKKIASQQTSHYETLLDMLVRADPQAHQT